MSRHRMSRRTAARTTALPAAAAVVLAGLLAPVAGADAGSSGATPADAARNLVKSALGGIGSTENRSYTRGTMGSGNLNSLGAVIVGTGSVTRNSYRIGDDNVGSLTTIVIGDHSEASNRGTMGS